MEALPGPAWCSCLLWEWGAAFEHVSSLSLNGYPVARFRARELRSGRCKGPMELPQSNPRRSLSSDPAASQRSFPRPSAGPSRAHRKQLSARGARGGLKFAPAGGAAARRAIGGARLICIDASAGRRSAPAAAFIGSAAPLSSAGAARAGRRGGGGRVGEGTGGSGREGGGSAAASLQPTAGAEPEEALPCCEGRRPHGPGN